MNKALRRFSSIAIDQAQKQSNAMVKRECGAVGLTENSNALRQWMLSSPEMARLVNEFEASMAPNTRTKENPKHHVEHRSFQVSFFKDVSSLAAAVKKTAMDTCNSFPEVTTAFLSLGNTPPVVDDTNMSTLERFVVLL